MKDCLAIDTQFELIISTGAITKKDYMSACSAGGGTLTIKLAVSIDVGHGGWAYIISPAYFSFFYAVVKGILLHVFSYSFTVYLLEV